MADYEFIEHTADIRMRVRGDNLEDLFRTAAFGMTAFLFGENSERSESPGAETSFRQPVRVAGQDLEDLLVGWLSELLLISSLRGARLVTVADLRIADNRLSAAVGLTPSEPQDEIKAVTYHDLAVARTGDTWTATITFDI